MDGQRVLRFDIKIMIQMREELINEVSSNCTALLEKGKVKRMER